MNIDKNSKEWREIEEFLTSKVEELRITNDNDLNEIETANIRGQIKLAKLVIDLPKESNSPEAADHSYL